MLTHEQKERYSTGWLKRKKEKEVQLKQKQEQAIEKAIQIAQLLKNKYGVQKAVLFGSLSKGYFWEHSDIDIAFYGTSEKQYLDMAWEASLIAAPFKLDLVPAKKATVLLMEKIEKEGKEL